MSAIATAPTATAPAASPNAKPLEGAIAPAPGVTLPQTYSAEEVEGFDGAELLVGAERGELPKSELPEFWTEENAGADDDEDGAPAAETETVTGEEAVEEEAAAAAAPEIPEAARTQIEAISKERDELKTQLAEARSLLAMPSAPSGTGPLAGVTEVSALQAHEEFAERIELWADEHREGGEMPRELQAAIEGKKIEDITEPRVLDREEAFALLKNSREMLRKHLPARREYLAKEKSDEGWLKENYPQYLDAATPEGQQFASFARQLPMLRALPIWRTVVACYTRGDQIIRAELAAKTKPKAAPQPAPAAPVPPMNGTRPAGRATPTIAKPNRSAQLRPSMSAEDLVAVM